MHITTTLRFHLIPVRMAKIINSRDHKYWRGCEERGKLLHCQWYCKLIKPFWISVWQFLGKMDIALPEVPALLLHGIYPEVAPTCIEDRCSTMFIAALFMFIYCSFKVYKKYCLNFYGNFIESVNCFGKTAIFTMLILPIRECGRSFCLLISSIISSFVDIKLLSLRSLICLFRVTPRYLIFFVAFVKVLFLQFLFQPKYHFYKGGLLIFWVNFVSSQVADICLSAGGVL